MNILKITYILNHFHKDLNMWFYNTKKIKKIGHVVNVPAYLICDSVKGRSFHADICSLLSRPFSKKYLTSPANPRPAGWQRPRTKNIRKMETKNLARSSHRLYRLRIPLSCFASTNSRFATRDHRQWKVCNSWIHLNCELLILKSFLTASKNDTTRQTDENWCSRRFYILFSKTGVTG
jgi:hypothetical protein